MRKATSKRLAFVLLFIFLLQVGLSWQLDTGLSSTFPQLLTNDLRIRHFSVKKDHRLRGETKSLKVHSEIDCVRYCMKDTCTSVNFQKSETNGIHVCELITKNMPKIELEGALTEDSSFDFISLESPINKDCDEIYKGGGKTSGVYSISPSPSLSVQVYCDMVTRGGGWTIIQKRMDGSVDFYRDWADFKRGFGNKLGEYWLGLDNIHTMTSQRSYRLRVDMEDFEGKTQYAEYDSFSVAGEQEKYRLTVGTHSGSLTVDSMAVHNGMEFSTKDRDNDDDSNQSCAVTFKGGWWYNACLNSNPNGRYLGSCKNACPPLEGIVWEHWHGKNYSLKGIEIKIRPKNF